MKETPAGGEIRWRCFPDTGAEVCGIALPRNCCLYRNARRVPPTTVRLANGETLTTDRVINYEMTVRGMNEFVEDTVTILGQAYALPHDGATHQLCIGRQCMLTHGIYAGGKFAKYAQTPEEGGKEIPTLLDQYYSIR